ncbi:hypothetical protein [Thalassospira profundimaris]|nr:hypothetical protein [Thalassospira profundimaris]
MPVVPLLLMLPAIVPLLVIAPKLAFVLVDIAVGATIVPVLLMLLTFAVPLRETPAEPALMVPLLVIVPIDALLADMPVDPLEISPVDPLVIPVIVALGPTDTAEKTVAPEAAIVPLLASNPADAPDMDTPGLLAPDRVTPLLTIRSPPVQLTQSKLARTVPPDVDKQLAACADGTIDGARFKASTEAPSSKRLWIMLYPHM